MGSGAENRVGEKRDVGKRDGEQGDGEQGDGTTAPDRRRTLTANRVVESAWEIADEEGIDHLTLSAVARSLGVRTPSLYNHVGGLDDLRERLTERALDELAAVLSRAAVGRSRDDALQSLARAYREFARAHPGIYPAVVPSSEGRATPIDEAGRRVLEVVLGALSGYAMARDEAIHAARTLRSAVHGFVTLELSGGFGLDTDPDDSFAWLVRTLAEGIRARDLPSPPLIRTPRFPPDRP